MWQEGLKIIVANPMLLGDILDGFGLMPNIETSTMGGAVFWDDLSNLDGWRIQRNKLIGNCRILDPNDIRKAWGGEKAVRKAFEYLIENYSSSSTSEKNNSFNPEDIPKLIREISELKDQGIITEDEFQEKKKKLLNQI